MILAKSDQYLLVNSSNRNNLLNWIHYCNSYCLIYFCVVKEKGKKKKKKERKKKKKKNQLIWFCPIDPKGDSLNYI